MSKASQEENTQRWDEAIRDAEDKIDRLRAAINSFTAHKIAGIPWPTSDEQHSV